VQLGTSTIVILNGPLGIGKSTLTEALSESIEQCVALDADRLVAANPLPDDVLGYLHSTLTLLIEHHRRYGYRHFVINHIWRKPAELGDLVRKIRELDGDVAVHCLLLTLPLDANLQRIERRRKARAIDDQEFEARMVLEERTALFESGSKDLGEPFDVSSPPDKLVANLLIRLAGGQ
jgi:shikimate kinase